MKQPGRIISVFCIVTTFTFLATPSEAVHAHKLIRLILLKGLVNHPLTLPIPLPLPIPSHKVPYPDIRVSFGKKGHKHHKAYVKDVHHLHKHHVHKVKPHVFFPAPSVHLPTFKHFPKLAGVGSKLPIFDGPLLPSLDKEVFPLEGHHGPGHFDHSGWDHSFDEGLDHGDDVHIDGPGFTKHEGPGDFFDFHHGAAKFEGPSLDVGEAAAAVDTAESHSPIVSVVPHKHDFGHGPHGHHHLFHEPVPFLKDDLKLVKS